MKKSLRRCRRFRRRLRFIPLQNKKKVDGCFRFFFLVLGEHVTRVDRQVRPARVYVSVLGRFWPGTTTPFCRNHSSVSFPRGRNHPSWYDCRSHRRFAVQIRFANAPRFCDTNDSGSGFRNGLEVRRDPVCGSGHGPRLGHGLDRLAASR